MRRIDLIKVALFLPVLLGVFAPFASAEEETPWQPLSGEGIKEALIGKVLDYDAAWQDFRASGKTLYHAGEDSWGNWRVESDQYCSQWPPRDLWDCYDVAQKGAQIRFRGAHDDETIGILRK